ncbi:hypothetical protein [Saccharicrinis sp. FJH62]|uniref:hypothetical protein n=1 Tax=Saccharicrinis sp. FJH62 TaxID=3344657 RepID=UPI0035D44615
MVKDIQPSAIGRNEQYLLEEPFCAAILYIHQKPRVLPGAIIIIAFQAIYGLLLIQYPEVIGSV